MHDLHPMHRSVSKSTMPSSLVRSAWVGQMETQGASVQWLHRSTEKNRLVSGQAPFPMYFTQVRSTPRGTWCSVLHATVQAWHPMHTSWSITKPYLRGSSWELPV